MTRRPGLSAALRAWGVPPGAELGHRSERNRLLDIIHIRRSRQCPKWVSKALPHADIYAGGPLLLVLICSPCSAL